MSRALPILFNTEMVRAILDGRKMATRRVIKKKQCVLMHKCEPTELEKPERWPFDGMTAEESIAGTYRPPYRWGDILYVRETWAQIKDIPSWEKYFRENGKHIIPTEYVYRADNVHVDGILPHITWYPSIHMPKEAARIWLKVTDVRAERINDMTLEDFLKEGVMIRPEAFNDPDNAYMQAKDAFIDIWDSTIRKPDLKHYGWDADPWVWVIEFERCEKPDEQQ